MMQRLYFQLEATVKIFRDLNVLKEFKVTETSKGSKKMLAGKWRLLAWQALEWEEKAGIVWVHRSLNSFETSKSDFVTAVTCYFWCPRGILLGFIT